VPLSNFSHHVPRSSIPQSAQSQLSAPQISLCSRKVHILLLAENNNHLIHNTERNGEYYWIMNRDFLLRFIFRALIRSKNI